MSGIFFDYLNRKFGFGETEANHFAGYLRPVTVRKGGHLLEVGQVCHFSAFIEKGAMVYYQLADGREQAVDFAFEEAWVSQVKSFSLQAPSEVGIKALEPTRLLRIEREQLADFFSKFPQYLPMRLTLAEESFLEMNERNLTLSALTAEERYLRLLERRPEIIRRAPQHYIATYLGILPESLSRIRKRII